VNIFTPFDHTVPWVIQAALVASGLLLLAGVLVRRKISAEGGGLIPDEGVSLRNFLEVLIESLANLAHDRMGEDWRRYFPIVGTIFFFVLISNLMSLVPGLLGSTSDANVTFGWAIISFLVYNYVGIAKHKWKYIYQFMGPALLVKEIGGTTYHIRVLAPFFLPLELVLHGARILTLGIRLLANMFADHQVIVIWLGLMPALIPALFMGLGMLVCFLQAFVFALLTMIYIGQALEEPH